MPLAKYISGHVVFRLSIAPIKSSDWTSTLLKSNYHARLGPLWKLTSLTNKHIWERQGFVCVVLLIAGFKSQYKPRDFLCRKTLPPWFNAYHMQREFSSTPPQWGARVATWTRCPILHAPPQTYIPLSQYTIILNSWNVVIQKLYRLFLLLYFFSHRSTASLPKRLVTVESHSFLCCLCSRLITANHYGSSDINRPYVCPTSDVDKFKVLLRCSWHFLRKTMFQIRIFNVSLAEQFLYIICPRKATPLGCMLSPRPLWCPQFHG